MKLFIFLFVVFISMESKAGDILLKCDGMRSNETTIRLEKDWTGKIKSLSFKIPDMKGWRTPFSFSANKYEIRFSDGWGYPYDDFNEEEKKECGKYWKSHCPLSKVIDRTIKEEKGTKTLKYFLFYETQCCIRSVDGLMKKEIGEVPKYEWQNSGTCLTLIYLSNYTKK